jgi:trk system potassium uptake protein TrkA/voltage-gated potassium channel
VLVVRIERADGTVIESPSPEEVIRTGDALAVVSKSGRSNLTGLSD